MRNTILLADDSVTIQKVVELTFLDEDFEVVAVSNGTQALTRLEEVAPDLVVADVHMPGASGLEVCRQSKRLRPGTPVLLLVGTFEPFDPAEATSAGADDYLKKPFDSQELLRRAKELIARGGAPALASAAPTAPALTAPAATKAAPPEWRPVEAPSAPAVEATPAADLLSWDREPFGFEGDGSTQVEPPADEPAFEFQLETEPPSSIPDEPLPFLATTAPLPQATAFASAAAAAIVAPPPVPVPESVVASPRVGELPLSDADVDRVARRVVELLGPRILREVAWEVVPDLAEVEIRARIRELEAELE